MIIASLTKKLFITAGGTDSLHSGVCNVWHVMYNIFHYLYLSSRVQSWTKILFLKSRVVSISIFHHAINHDFRLIVILHICWEFFAIYPFNQIYHIIFHSSMKENLCEIILVLINRKIDRYNNQHSYLKFLFN